MALYWELVTQLNRVYGRQHPETLAARYHLATNTGRANDHATAARVHAELLPDLTAAHGPDAQRVLTARLSLAFEVGETEEYGKSVALLERLVKDLDRVLAPEARDHIAVEALPCRLHGVRRRPAEAARLYHELLASTRGSTGTATPRPLALATRTRH